MFITMTGRARRLASPRAVLSPKGDCMKFGVKITESLSKTVIVDADDFSSAMEKVSTMYRSCGIILDSDDFFDVSFDESQEFGTNPISEDDSRLELYKTVD